MMLLKIGRMIIAAGIATACAAGAVFPAILTVAQNGSGQFTSVQAAVDAASPGDEIVIMDASAYNEQVTIDSTKNRLVLRCENPPSSLKPTIHYQDKKNVGPRTCEEAKDSSKLTFDRNGALQVLGATGVRIEGIIVDGGGVFPFGYDGIWTEGETACKWPLQHGNAAVTLWMAGEVIIRDCDIRNAFFGIYLKDRNEGGIYASANPADVYPEDVVPFSGFARTGNHLIEYNRIHDNSFGLSFESTWDQGSTVRYNLIFENHHPTSTIAQQVKGLTADGANLPGGAFMFKDHMLSPVAIYNNTFWHNMFLFVGNWNNGGVHLVFNNIFSQPYTYWGKESVFGGQGWQEMASVFPYRMNNCVFAAQQQAPDPNYVSIMNDMGRPEIEGDLIPATYPAEADVRWLETKFLSTDPANPDFLTPDWNDSLVQKYIIDKGWPVTGVKDPDKSPADLGAVPKGGGRLVDVITVRQTRPVVFDGSTANMSFTLSPRIGAVNDPRFVFLRFIRNLDSISNFGNDCPQIEATQIQTITFPVAPIAADANEYSVTISNPGTYGFFEFFIEGTGSDGNAVMPAAGFLPYRKIDYLFNVSVLDQRGGEKMAEVYTGVPVVLRVEAIKKGGLAFTNKVDPTSVRLQSSFELHDLSGTAITSISGGVTGAVELDVIFPQVPAGGVEYVSVSGQWVDGTKIIPFLGCTEGIRVLSDPIAVRPATAGLLRSDKALVELIDLRGRVLKRFVAGHGYADRATRVAAMAVNGMFLVRMTDIATGRVIVAKRMMLGR